MRARRLLAAGAAALLAACGSASGDEAPRDDVLALVHAARRGDVQGQMGPLVAPEDRNANGARVLRVLLPDYQLRYFEPRSAELGLVRNDTAYWEVKGTAPDYSGVDFTVYRDVAGMRMPQGVREPTPAEVAALPRKPDSHVVVLVRRPEGWRLPLESARVGPLLMELDSMEARCPTNGDPRPCRAMAERLIRGTEALPPAARDRFGFIPVQAGWKLREAQAMDSVRLDLVSDEPSAFSRYTHLEIAIVNRSSIDLRAILYRVLDAEGSVLVRHGWEFDLPARGRKEKMELVDARSYPRPARLELVSVYLPD
jgi:hypothetical protein